MSSVNNLLSFRNSSSVVLEIEDHVARRSMREALPLLTCVRNEIRPPGVWVRDVAVVLPNGNLLLPTEKRATKLFAQSFIAQMYALFSTLFPCDKMGTGRGGGSSVVPNVDKQRETLRSSLYIEGGNILWFKHHEESCAIVGVASVFWSALFRYEESSTLPEAEVIVDEMRQEMARELGIFPQNILFLAHRGVHIDLECAIHPANKAILVDPNLTALAYMKAKREEETANTIVHNLGTGSPTDDIAYQMYTFNAKTLKDFGLDVVGVPNLPTRIYGFQGVVHLLNGLWFYDEENSITVFATRALPARNYRLAQEFDHVMRENQIAVIYIQTDSFATGGGLHCLTREERKEISHQTNLAYIPYPILQKSILLKTQVVIELNPIELEEAFYQIEDESKNPLQRDLDRYCFSCMVPYNRPLLYSVFHGNKKIWRSQILPGQHQMCQLNTMQYCKD